MTKYYKYRYGHINMLGRYSFAMPDEVKGGELRALGTTKKLKSVGCSIAPQGRNRAAYLPHPS